MYYHVICCNGYYSVGATNCPDAAVEMAREHRDGSYTCVISQNGRIVGDCVDGIMGPIPEGAPPYDHATATGMYDRL